MPGWAGRDQTYDPRRPRTRALRPDPWREGSEVPAQVLNRQLDGPLVGLGHHFHLDQFAEGIIVAVGTPDFKFYGPRAEDVRNNLDFIRADQPFLAAEYEPSSHETAYFRSCRWFRLLLWIQLVAHRPWSWLLNLLGFRFRHCYTP